MRHVYVSSALTGGGVCNADEQRWDDLLDDTVPSGDRLFRDEDEIVRAHLQRTSAAQCLLKV